MKIVIALKKSIKELDQTTKKIMNSGFKFSFILCLVSALTLVVYESMFAAPNLFYIGITLFKTASMFAACFLAFGVAFDTIKKQMAA